MILPPGMIGQRGIVPSQQKKYFADKESEAVVPEKIEFDFFIREGKSLLLISSTITGTKKIDVSKRYVISARGKTMPTMKKNLVKKIKGS